MRKLDMMINALAGEYDDYAFAKKELRKEFFSQVEEEISFGNSFDDAYGTCLKRLEIEYNLKMIETFDPRLNKFLDIMEEILFESPSKLMKVYDDTCYLLLNALEENKAEEQLNIFKDVADELEELILTGHFDNIKPENIKISFI